MHVPIEASGQGGKAREDPLIPYLREKKSDQMTSGERLQNISTNGKKEKIIIRSSGQEKKIGNMIKYPFCRDGLEEDRC